MVDKPSYRETACYFCVEDLPGASVPGARLQKILDCIQASKPVTPRSLDFLQKQGLESLHRLVTSELSYDSFRALALDEQVIRIESTMASRLVREAEKEAERAAMLEGGRLAREKAAAEREARERDPKYIARIKNQELRARYGINFYVEQHHFPRVMRILKSVEADQRMGQEDFEWLCSEGEDYFSDALWSAYHRLEAAFFVGEFNRTRDPWMAVNASSHYRKCGRAGDADSLLGSINVDQQKTARLQSALCTTRGGAKRDLQDWNEGIRLGEKAHALTPKHFHPCTLLGAIYMELGNYSRGQEWYAKAVERGATVESVDRDIRTIFRQSGHDKQVEMRTFLLSDDPDRYEWAQ